MKKKISYPYIVISLIVLLAAGLFAKAAGGREQGQASGSSGYESASGREQGNATGGGAQDSVSDGRERGTVIGDGEQGTVAGSGEQGSAADGGKYGTVAGSGEQGSAADGGEQGSASDSGQGDASGSSAEEGVQGELQEKKKIALTFDDGPDAEYTPMLLDGLAERGVKVTFFVIGKQAQEQPELMQRIVEEGHLIGNHTYNHVDIRHMTETAAKEEIQKANKVIAQFTGEEPSFLRPPFGSGSTKLEKELEMIQVLWTIDTMDWSCKNEAKICSTVYKEVEENSIILMHDEYPATVRAALSIIDQLQKEGYEFVTVDEIILG